MKQIGFDVGGHSQYDDLVWATLNEIADQYGLVYAKVIVKSYTSNRKKCVKIMVLITGYYYQQC